MTARNCWTAASVWCCSSIILASPTLASTRSGLSRAASCFYQIRIEPRCFLKERLCLVKIVPMHLNIRHRQIGNRGSWIDLLFFAKLLHRLIVNFFRSLVEVELSDPVMHLGQFRVVAERKRIFSYGLIVIVLGFVHFSGQLMHPIGIRVSGH